MFACLPQLLSQNTSDQLRKIELGIHVWGREDIDSPAWKAVEKTLGRPQFQRLREISFKLNTPVTLDRKMLAAVIKQQLPTCIARGLLTVGY
jgi:hypothetical protein